MAHYMAVCWVLRRWVTTIVIGSSVVCWVLRRWVTTIVIGSSVVCWVLRRWVTTIVIGSSVVCKDKSILQAMKTGVRADLGRRLFCGG